MSTDTDADDGAEHSTLELRQMDREQARQTLPVAQYERWEQLNDLRDGAEQTREQWADEDDRVADLTVRADMDALGTEVDLFGNDVLVHIDSEDPALRETVDALEDDYAGLDTDGVEDMDDTDTAELADHLLDLLDTVIVRWNGHEWSELPDPTRGDVLADARSKWGVDGLLLAWTDIAIAVNEDREERADVIESFRNEERRGRR